MLINFKFKNLKLIKNIPIKPINKNSLINTVLFNGWMIHESSQLINYQILDHPVYESVFHIMTLVWQYVGLFIIAHDLHHDRNPSKYDSILGRLSIFFYGGFMLEDFSDKHQLHHKCPGRDEIKCADPDFYDGNIFIWYLNFMKRYVNIKQILVQISFHTLAKNMGISEENLILFWALPSILASMQLFYYGTYLTHGKNGEIRTTNFPRWLQTLTCYNFGYHEKHHSNPEIKWQDLD